MSKAKKEESEESKNAGPFLPKFWRRAKVIILTTTVIAFWGFVAMMFLGSDDLFSSSNCNVQGIKLYGKLDTYGTYFLDSDDEKVAGASSQIITQHIREAQKDDSIKAIILEIDSGGGGSVPGGEIASELKRSTKPTLALIREMGASAAYKAASGANWIMAAENSSVGSIGVTQSYLDYSAKNTKEGLTYIELSSGKFKDSGDPDKPLSEEEKQIFMRDIKIVYENFVKEISENRHIDIEKVRQLADGSTMLGRMALENGLIDQIGGLFEAERYIEDKIKEKPEICWAE